MLPGGSPIERGGRLTDCDCCLFRLSWFEFLGAPGMYQSRALPLAGPGAASGQALVPPGLTETTFHFAVGLLDWAKALL